MFLIMQKQKIILVDDQPLYRNVVKTVLQNIGDVEIIAEASNGVDFLELLNTHRPDIIFMDIEMPRMDGIEATKKALEKNPDLVIIGLSMYENKNYVDELVKAGARGYLLKLSDNDEIFKSILKHPKAEIFYSEKLVQKASASKSKDKKTVLVVDDFESNTFVTALTLENAGYGVSKASTGKDALELLRNEKFDLVVTDYNMPGMNGMELVKELRKMPGYAKIPVLVLSTIKDEQKKELTKTVGVTGWIEKPFQLQRFLKIVKKALM